METAGPSFNGPSGTAVNTAKCNQSSVGCLQKASQVCGGQYLILDSEGHSGGLLADTLPGPVTWYGMTYQCGASDGKMPTFAFRGQQYVDSPTVVVNTPSELSTSSLSVKRCCLRMNGRFAPEAAARIRCDHAHPRNDVSRPATSE